MVGSFYGRSIDLYSTEGVYFFLIFFLYFRSSFFYTRFFFLRECRIFRGDPYTSWLVDVPGVIH